MKKRILFLMISVLILSMGCGKSPRDQVKDGSTPSKIETKEGKDFYETIGMGAPSENATNVASEKQTSYEAAKAAALNDLAGYLYGVKLESGMEVQDAIAQNSSIKTEVAAFIRGAEIVNREWDDQNSCIVTMRINVKDFKEKLKELGVE
ncbi:MAG: hypothetical protein ACQERZ_01370 [Fusobacteriota bacterium]